MEFFLDKKKGNNFAVETPSDPRRCLRSYWPVASVEPRASRNRSATSSRWPRPETTNKNAGFVTAHKFYIHKVCCFVLFRHIGEPLSKKSWWVLFLFPFLIFQFPLYIFGTRGLVTWNIGGSLVPNIWGTGRSVLLKSLRHFQQIWNVLQKQTYHIIDSKHLQMHKLWPNKNMSPLLLYGKSC